MLKKFLRCELTTLVHGEEEAEKAKEASKALFSGAGGMENVPTTEMEKSRFEGDGVGLRVSHQGAGSGSEQQRRVPDYRAGRSFSE